MLRGRLLREWLLDLTDPDPAVREAAGEVLRATRVGVRDADPADEALGEDPEVLTAEAIAAAWREMIGRVFLVPGFPGGATAIHLARKLMAIHAALRAKVDRGDEVDFENDESISAAAMAAGWVLECVGPGGSDVVPTLAEMLRADGGAQAYLAADALAGIGPAARAAVPALIEAVRAQGANEHPYRKGRALAAIAGDDPAVVRSLADLLSAPEPTAREGACAALRVFGPRAAAAVPALVAATGHPHPETRSMAAYALGTVAAGQPAVVDVLRPLTDDQAWWVRGSAIAALGKLGLRLPELIPTFVAALADDDGDGDWTVREQAAEALAAAGPAAGPAVPALVARLRDAGGEVDADILHALTGIGPAARAALPALHALLTDERAGFDEDEITAAISRITANADPDAPPPSGAAGRASQRRSDDA